MKRFPWALVVWMFFVTVAIVMMVFSDGNSPPSTEAANWGDSTLQAAVPEDALKFILDAAGGPGLIPTDILQRAQELEQRVERLEILCDLLARELLLRTWQREEIRLGGNAPPRPAGLRVPFIDDIVEAWRDLKRPNPK